MAARATGTVVIGVDTGGTFTDVFASDGRVVKVPSSPDNPARAILQGLRSAGVQQGDAVGHGTTVATNAVLERRGALTALITTAGFEDVLEIRRQDRPSLYGLRARWEPPLVPASLRFGITERLDFAGNVLCDLAERDIAALGTRLRGMGVESVAICLLFSYANPEHERRVADHVRESLGASVPVTVSHEVAPRYGEYERTSTSVVNAYVMPVMQGYLATLENGLGDLGASRLHVMQSSGGLVPAHEAALRPVNTILSGPAGGVVGAQILARSVDRNDIITFDMGGTSTDVAVVPGEILDSSVGEISSFPLLVPMLTIETVGAGGGSIARVDEGGALHVGPQSAGAMPGPAAYGSGTLPTVTDANLVLGRLSPSGLLGGAMPLEADRSRRALQCIAAPLGLSVEEAAWAVVRLANSNMDRAVRSVTLQRGHDPRRFTLFPFGGAGPLHAAELAEALGISTILVPPHPGVMAALGLTVPDLRRHYERTVLLLVNERTEDLLRVHYAELEEVARRDLVEEDLFGAPAFALSADMRYAGQSFDLRIPFTSTVRELVAAFHRAYAARYGDADRRTPVEIAHVRVEAVSPRLERPSLIPDWPEGTREPTNRDVFFGQGVAAHDIVPARAEVWWRPSLPSGWRRHGPVVLEQYDSTTLVPPGWSVQVDEGYNLLLVHP